MHDEPPDDPTDKEVKAAEKQAQAETKGQSGREAMAEYRARETASDDNANRLKGLRLAREAEAAAEEASAPTATPNPRRSSDKRPDEGLRPDQLTTENDG